MAIQSEKRKKRKMKNEKKHAAGRCRQQIAEE
jgi:hypothetical protein